MRSFFALLTSGLLAVALSACDGGVASPESGEVEPTPESGGAQIDDWFTYEPSRPDEYGVPTQADPEIHEAYVRAHLEAGTYDEATFARFEVRDHDALEEALNSGPLAELETKVSGQHGSYVQRHEMIFEGLAERSDAELTEICEKVSEFLARVPEMVELVGPVAFVGSHYVESEDQPGFFPVTPVFYNDRLAPGATGACTVL